MVYEELVILGVMRGMVGFGRVDLRDKILQVPDINAVLSSLPTLSAFAKSPRPSAGVMMASSSERKGCGERVFGGEKDDEGPCEAVCKGDQGEGVCAAAGQLWEFDRGELECCAGG